MSPIDHTGSRGRRGNLLIVLSILSMVMLLALGSLSFLTRTDVTTSLNLVREFKATSLAESIATQVEARVNRHPWNRRFWMVLAQEAGTVDPGTGLAPALTFDQSSGQVDLSGDSLPPEDYGFAAVVKDVDPSLREYRIFVEVTLEDETYSFSWDKRYQESLMSALNRDTSRLDKNVEETPPGRTDQLVEQVRSAAEAPSDDLQGRIREIIQQIKKDEESYQGTTTIPPRPEGAPPLPATPQLGGP